MAGGIRFFSASFMRSLSCGKMRDFWPRNRVLARNPAFSGAKGVQQAAKSQVGKNDERQKGSGAPRRVPERGFVAKNARFCCTIEKGARKWSKDAHPKRETTRMEGTASKRCAVRMLHPKRLVTPKGPHQARHRPPPATAPALPKNGGVRKQPCHVRRRYCRVRKQRSARRGKPRARRDSALPAPCPSRHCRPARVSSAAKPLSREGVGGGAYRAKPSALTAIPTQPRLRRHRHSVTIDNPLQPHSLKARGRPMQTPR